jgi:hypothetical protein
MITHIPYGVKKLIVHYRNSSNNKIKVSMSLQLTASECVGSTSNSVCPFSLRIQKNSSYVQNVVYLWSLAP